MTMPAVETASFGRSQRSSKYEYLLKIYSATFDFLCTKTSFYKYVIVKCDCFQEWLIPLLGVTLYWNNVSGLFADLSCN